MRDISEVIRDATALGWSVTECQMALETPREGVEPIMVYTLVNPDGIPVAFGVPNKREINCWTTAEKAWSDLPEYMK